MLPKSQLIMGGQKSGKSRYAELLARAWLHQSPAHEAVLIATATAHDDEMASRIARHRADRAVRVPLLRTVEEAIHLPQAIAAHSAANTVLIVDCLTLWLTNLLMPAQAADALSPEQVLAHSAQCVHAVQQAAGPVILVSNEIGLGVIPMQRPVRQFVDSLGLLNQSLAACCDRVNLMVAGQPLIIKNAL